jgi:hypothetical protein
VCSKSEPNRLDEERENRSKGQTSGLERASIALGLTLKFADGIESKHKGMLETVNMLRKRKGEACAAGIF